MLHENKNDMPSVWRRMAVVLGYSAVITMVLAVVVLFLSSSDCVQYGNCSDQDKLVSTIASLIYWVAIAYVILAGWMGRLYGCRKK